MAEIGLIGLGTIGEPMAGRLVDAEYDVVVYDVRDEPMERVEAAGGQPCCSAQDLAESAEIVLLSLPGPSEVRDVVLGTNGILSALDQDTVVIDTTTSSPSLTDELARELRAKNVQLLSAPVSGGKTRVRDGELSVMVGGDPDVLALCKPYLETFAGSIIHVGKQPRHGHLMKLLNQYLCLSAMITTSETIALGEDAGIDMGTMLDVFNESSGRNFRTEHTFPTEILTDEYDIGGSFRLIEKDIRTVVNYSRDAQMMLLLGSSVHHVIAQARSFYGDDEDFSHLYPFVADVMDLNDDAGK
jgi:3-hydroxyisobutyrate dehydrogenase